MTKIEHAPTTTDDLISHIEARAVVVPMQTPHRTAGGVITESPLVLIDVTTQQGIVGHGLLFTYTTRALKSVAELVGQMGELLHNQPLAPRALESLLGNQFRLLGTQGLVGMALAGLDMALWDAHTKACNTSLVKLLGGKEEPVAAYAGIGYEGAEGSARQAREWVDQGFLAVKAKIGYPTLKEDLAVIRAIRETIGDDVELMVDYNQCLKPQEAIQRLRKLDGEALSWVEEPTLAHDYAGHALIQQRCTTPIQCGENWWGTQDMQHAIEAGASSYMMPDVMKIGGVSGWLRAADLAQAKGILVSSHLWPDISAQLLNLTPTCHWLEYIDWWNPILQDPIEIKDGFAITQNRQATGTQWNEQAANQYTVYRAQSR